MVKDGKLALQMIFKVQNNLIKKQQLCGLHSFLFHEVVGENYSNNEVYIHFIEQSWRRILLAQRK